ncbi:MAG: tRNA uridine-5-carboxymethylaminomethyl(34) synthesis enzyme MnmG [Bacteroidota bacterium]
MIGPFDVIVVGAGHAGCEAAVSAANLGSKTLLITMNVNTIAQMSCNPAIGGIAKGQLVREIDALGGMCGVVSDNTTVQFRMLNRSKGPAMWSPRAQIDKFEFAKLWKHVLENTPNLQLWQDTVVDILVDGGKACGVVTQMGLKIVSKAVVLTNGTFLNGKIHIGEYTTKGGRIGELTAEGLTESLVKLGFEAKRLKTGTPMRIAGNSIDFSKLEEQFGDDQPSKFSFTKTPELKNQLSCFIAYTSLEVHNSLREGFEQSPLFTGRIKGVGPRYCPSIEDKIERFSDKNRHQLFLEPEGRDSSEYYLNGFSSSLPLEIQYRSLKLIPGFENATIIKPGYAIEYDYFPPTQLNHALETKLIQNLYFAGQINGTTGYEEAGSQGLMAGINSHRKVNNLEPIVLKRTESYIGVLIDDLVTKGVDEPYRMFTSRAEYRILLRQDNADFRLSPIGFEIGLISEARLQSVKEKYRKCEAFENYLKEFSLEPSKINYLLIEKDTAELTQRIRAYNLILRPQISLVDLINADDQLQFNVNENKLTVEEIESVEILIKYKSYIDKEFQTAQKIDKFDEIRLPEDLDYFSFSSLSWEAREKLTKIRPATIGQASRISGVSPSDISVLLVYFGR